MPDEGKTEAQQTADTGARPANQSASAPQGEPAPDDRFAAIETRFSKLEQGYEKEVHSLKTALGREQAKLRVATENAAGFTAAWDNYEESKAVLLEQGYSEEEIESLVKASPSALKKLARNAPTATSQASVKSPVDEVKALREEIAAMKAAQAQTAGTGRVSPSGGASVPPERSLEQLLNVDTRRKSHKELQEHDKILTEAIRRGR